MSSMSLFLSFYPFKRISPKPGGAGGEGDYVTLRCLSYSESEGRGPLSLARGW